MFSVRITKIAFNACIYACDNGLVLTGYLSPEQ